MSHQINLCPQRPTAAQVRWGARHLAIALASTCLLTLTITTWWVMQLQTRERAALQQTQLQQQSIAALQKQLGLEASAVALSGPALATELQARRLELARLQTRVQQLQRGMMTQGAGHAARLEVVARSIPPSAWLTQLKLDDNHLELSGATLEPAGLNAWIDELASHPLLKNQTLHAVKVERMPSREGQARWAKGTVWQFTLAAGGA
jgi:Tfp pilus assembly protein PilN